jgi:hypothetical protein
VALDHGNLSLFDARLIMHARSEHFTLDIACHFSEEDRSSALWRFGVATIIR